MSDRTIAIAHASEDGRLHYLEDHLSETSHRAADFAGRFGCGEWGRLLGRWHDLGKYSPTFQTYISFVTNPDAHVQRNGGDHSIVGAQWAVERLGVAGRLLAYAIAGHHAGLADWMGDETGRKALSLRLRQRELLEAVKNSGIPEKILAEQMPKERPKAGADPAFWIRLLFSCLVDADFLDTEKFFDPEGAVQRGSFPPLADFLPLYKRYMEEKAEKAVDTTVNRIRSAVLRQCVRRASDSPGIYTLTVPTGGGKTLSSLAFALHHSAAHGKERVIYVIPYTSIIEQTANQFRDIFGDAVIEHHSNLDVSDESKETAQSRLACENWDAPIIVTTSVQFFESLFASRTSRCRKLHSIVNSVVVLDEAQLLPPEFLTPILHALTQLTKNYGVTVLLTTATQPAFSPRPEQGFAGLPGMREIIEDPLALHNQLKRTELVLPDSLLEACSWQDLASELAGHRSVLCIVNRRDDARALWELMPEGTFHLSALMCGQHRSETIGAIRQCLKDGKPTRVVSTQLVEAGVDLDFPVAYRALAGLDSIAQAAGRCNREGLRQQGLVHLFVPPSQPPPGVLRQAEGLARQLLGEEAADHLAPERFTRFFRELYWHQGERLDKKCIMEDLCPAHETEFRYSFRTAADKFRIIDETAHAAVLVSYGTGGALIERLEARGPDRDLMRRLQRHVVNLPRYLHRHLLDSGAIREIHGIYIQGHSALYHGQLGFCPDRSLLYSPDDLVF